MPLAIGVKIKYGKFNKNSNEFAAQPCAAHCSPFPGSSTSSPKGLTPNWPGSGQFRQDQRKRQDFFIGFYGVSKVVMKIFLFFPDPALQWST